jgi:hypothetical protein
MLIEHLLRMCLRCGGERWIPLERLQPLLSPGLVRQVEELLLLRGWNLLRMGENAKD